MATQRDLFERFNSTDAGLTALDRLSTIKSFPNDTIILSDKNNRERGIKIKDLIVSLGGASTGGVSQSWVNTVDTLSVFDPEGYTQTSVGDLSSLLNLQGLEGFVHPLANDQIRVEWGNGESEIISYLVSPEQGSTSAIMNEAADRVVITYDDGTVPGSARTLAVFHQGDTTWTTYDIDDYFSGFTFNENGLAFGRTTGNKNNLYSFIGDGASFKLIKFNSDNPVLNEEVPVAVPPVDTISSLFVFDDENFVFIDEGQTVRIFKDGASVTVPVAVLGENSTATTFWTPDIDTFYTSYFTDGDETGIWRWTASSAAWTKIHTVPEYVEGYWVSPDGDNIVVYRPTVGEAAYVLDISLDRGATFTTVTMATLGITGDIETGPLALYNNRWFFVYPYDGSPTSTDTEFTVGAVEILNNNNVIEIEVVPFTTVRNYFFSVPAGAYNTNV